MSINFKKSLVAIVILNVSILAGCNNGYDVSGFKEYISKDFSSEIGELVSDKVSISGVVENLTDSVKENVDVEGVLEDAFSGVNDIINESINSVAGTNTDTDNPNSESVINNIENGSSDEYSSNSENSDSNGEFRVILLDTGNSDAILLVETDSEGNNIAALIDAGDYDDYDLINEYLEKYNISELKYMIITHYHADHFGSATKLINNTPIDKLLVSNGAAESKTYTTFIETCANLGKYPSVPVEGAEFNLNNAYFKIYNTNGGSSTNNESLVVKVYYGNNKYLFTGDAERETEFEMIQDGVFEDVDFYKAAHHGSSTSNSDEMLDIINSEIIAITCDENNSYGHPHQNIVDKFINRGIELYRTDQNGTITVLSDGGKLSVTSER